MDGQALPKRITHIGQLRDRTGDRPLVWLSGGGADRRGGGIGAADVQDAKARLARFEGALAEAFAAQRWDGRICSDLLPLAFDGRRLFLKADHALPVTGSVKARGGAHEILKLVEDIARREGLIADEASDRVALLGPQARSVFADYRVLVGSTGNLGFSIGLFARAFGLQAEVHMSADAKQWKKQRLRRLGVNVVEHQGDFTQAVAEARRAATLHDKSYFVDDECSPDLMAGYATAAEELVGQLRAAGIEPHAERPALVYLPCGVGGAPAGITFALKHLLGDAVACIFVEPIGSACVLAAMLSDRRSTSVYGAGLDNVTIADGLAVPKASQLALDCAGADIDAIVALPDDRMLAAMLKVWREQGLRLEPSAAASLAAVAPLRAALDEAGAVSGPLRFAGVGVHIAWATGGSLMPAEEFDALLDLAARRERSARPARVELPGRKAG